MNKIGEESSHSKSEIRLGLRTGTLDDRPNTPIRFAALCLEAWIGFLNKFTLLQVIPQQLPDHRTRLDNLNRSQLGNKKTSAYPQWARSRLQNFKPLV